MEGLFDNGWFNNAMAFRRVVWLKFLTMVALTMGLLDNALLTMVVKQWFVQIGF